MSQHALVSKGVSTTTAWGAHGGSALLEGARQAAAEDAAPLALSALMQQHGSRGCSCSSSSSHWCARQPLTPLTPLCASWLRARCAGVFCRRGARRGLSLQGGLTFQQGAPGATRGGQAGGGVLGRRGRVWHAPPAPTRAHPPAWAGAAARAVQMVAGKVAARRARRAVALAAGRACVRALRCTWECTATSSRPARSCGVS